MQQLVAVISTVIDQHVVFAQLLQMRQRNFSFVAMRHQLKVNRNVRLQLIQSAHKSLRIMGLVIGSAITVFKQLPGQVELVAVNRTQTVSLSQKILSFRFAALQNALLQDLEDLLIQLAHPAHGSRTYRL